MPQQLVTPNIVSYIGREVMKRNGSTFRLPHPELLTFAEKPFSQSFSGSGIDLWVIKMVGRI
jgi:hypothetical protein